MNFQTNSFKYLFLLMISFGCTSKRINSDNVVLEGQVVFKEGVYNSKSWKEELVFNRYGWYKTMNMQYELLVTSIDKDSKFNNWFSQSEMNSVKKCSNVFITISFNSVNSLFGDDEIRSEFSNLEVDPLIVNGFKKHIQNHPSFNAHNLQKYSIKGHCQKNAKRLKDMKVNFPGYKTTLVKF